MPSAANATAFSSQQREDESRVPQLMGAYITCLVIAFVGVMLRFLARNLKKTPLKTDDWLIVVSLVSARPKSARMWAYLTVFLPQIFTTAFTAIEIVLTTTDGLGRHEMFITDTKLFALVRHALRLNFVCVDLWLRES